MLLKIVVVLAGLALGLFLLRRTMGPAKEDRDEAARLKAEAQKAKAAAKAAKAGQKLLQCAFCGTHVPAEEAVRIGNKSYCSLIHARRGDQPPDA